MKATEQTLQQLNRTLRKIADKFPANEEATLLTDIHIRVNQETGELTVFDDDDKEITRSVIEQWIDNKDDGFYNDITGILRSTLQKHKAQIEQMSILKPFCMSLTTTSLSLTKNSWQAWTKTLIVSCQIC